MQQAGAYVKEEVCRALIVLISNAPELHGYAARSMYRALQDSIHQAELTLSLVTSTCWFLGESFPPKGVNVNVQAKVPLVQHRFSSVIMGRH